MSLSWLGAVAVGQSGYNELMTAVAVTVASRMIPETIGKHIDPDALPEAATAECFDQHDEYCMRIQCSSILYCWANF